MTVTDTKNIVDADSQVFKEFPDSKLKARRLLLLDDAYTTLKAAGKLTSHTSGEAERKVLHAEMCIELAKEIRIGLPEFAKNRRLNRFPMSEPDQGE
jgi:hypothetical protein